MARSSIPEGTTYVQMRPGGWERFKGLLAQTGMPDSHAQSLREAEEDVLQSFLLGIQRNLWSSEQLLAAATHEGFAAILLSSRGRFEHVLVGRFAALVPWLRDLLVDDVMAL